MSAPLDEIAEWFSRYLEVREAWERGAFRRRNGPEADEAGEGWDEILAEYDAIAAEYFDPPVRDDSLVFGDPPGVAVATTRNVVIRQSDPDEAIVMTVEWSSGLPTEHRYRLRRVDRGWRLVDRRARAERRWHKRLR